MVTKSYVGNELETFEKAVNWKRYYTSFMKPFLKGNVLEVGAGIGGITIFLCDGSQKSWVCLEPDAKLTREIKQKIKTKKLPDSCKAITGTIDKIPKTRRFDTIIYIDVIEHIKNDSKELEEAIKRLVPNGFLIIGAPAQQWLYSKFDKAIGHYRRYNKKMLKSALPAALKEKKLIYIDSMGMFLSASNKILKQNYPTEKQVMFWSNVVINFSKLTDKILRYSVGKQIIGVWQKV